MGNPPAVSPPHLASEIFEDILKGLLYWYHFFLILVSFQNQKQLSRRTRHKKEEAEDSDRLCKIHDLCERKASVTHQMKMHWNKCYVILCDPFHLKFTDYSLIFFHFL